MIDLHVDYDRADRARAPEVRLWTAVLVRACHDAEGINCHDEPGQVHAAREWLFADPNPDRDEVCQLAGADPARLRAWARSRLPDYALPPRPLGNEARSLLRELQRSPPPNLLNWAAEVGVSALWALEQRRYLTTNAQLADLLRDRLDVGAVDIAQVARETGASEQRVYLAIYAQRRDGADVQPLQPRCYARSPRHYFDHALRDGRVDVYLLAAATGYPSRRFRGLVDSARRAGASLVCVAPGVFALSKTTAPAPNLSGNKTNSIIQPRRRLDVAQQRTRPDV